MCVIIISPENTVITREIMQTGIERNPHGWGFTSINREAKTFYVEHGEGLIQAWKTWRKFQGTERIFHARVSTSGKVNRQNQHPFDVSGKFDKERWFFHNGMIHDIPEIDSNMCDSWHMSQIIASTPTSDELLKNLNKSAYKNSSRYVLATLEMTWYFGKKWLMRDGVLYSNASALGEGKMGGSRAAFAGGEFNNKDIEITCADEVSEFGYDRERKLWSSHIAPPKPVVSTYSHHAPSYVYNKSSEASKHDAKEDKRAASGSRLALVQGNLARESADYDGSGYSSGRKHWVSDGWNDWTSGYYSDDEDRYQGIDRIKDACEDECRAPIDKCDEARSILDEEAFDALYEKKVEISHAFAKPENHYKIDKGTYVKRDDYDRAYEHTDDKEVAEAVKTDMESVNGYVEQNV